MRNNLILPVLFVAFLGGCADGPYDYSWEEDDDVVEVTEEEVEDEDEGGDEGGDGSAESFGFEDFEFGNSDFDSYSPSSTAVNILTLNLVNGDDTPIPRVGIGFALADDAEASGEVLITLDSSSEGIVSVDLADGEYIMAVSYSTGTFYHKVKIFPANLSEEATIILPLTCDDSANCVVDSGDDISVIQGYLYDGSLLISDERVLIDEDVSDIRIASDLTSSTGEYFFAIESTDDINGIISVPGLSYTAEFDFLIDEVSYIGLNYQFIDPSSSE